MFRLLHPRVLLRLSDTGAYGNEYSPADMLTDLTAAVFEADLAGGVNGYRQNLQTEYVHRLLKITAEGSEYDYRSQSLALNRLRWVEGQLAGSRGRRAVDQRTPAKHRLPDSAWPRGDSLGRSISARSGVQTHVVRS